MKDDRKRFFQVIQGKLPSEREMRNKIPKQFSDLKLTIVKQYFAELMDKFGSNLECIHSKSISDKHLKEIYNTLNNEMEGLIKQAEYVKYYKEHPEEKHIGKEPGE